MTEKNLQVSGNIGNAYFIFKGDTTEEFEAELNKFAAAYDRIADKLQVIQQVQAVKEAFAEKQGFGGRPSGGAPAVASGGDKPKGSFNRPAQPAGQGGGGGAVQLGPDGNGTCPHTAKLLDYRKDGGTGVRVHGWYCQSKDKDFKKKCRPLNLEGHGE